MGARDGRDRCSYNMRQSRDEIKTMQRYVGTRDTKGSARQGSAQKAPDNENVILMTQKINENGGTKRGVGYYYGGGDGGVGSAEDGGGPRFRRSSATVSMLLRLFSSTGFVSTLETTMIRFVSRRSRSTH